MGGSKHILTWFLNITLARINIPCESRYICSFLGLFGYESRLRSFPFLLRLFSWREGWGGPRQTPLSYQYGNTASSGVA